MNVIFCLEDCTKTEASFLKKFDKKEKFTNDELEKLAYYFSYEEEKRCLDNLTQSVKSIVRAEDRCFAIDWILVEMENGHQEGIFENQPYEVRPISHQKIITVTDWVRI